MCGPCHKLHGEGQDVGPDLTLNGRNSFEQLLSNVFDPSLVIGAAYQARTVVTEDGRVLTGLLVEENDQRVVLKTQGGKLETIARGEVDAMKTSRLSLMPEALENQLKPRELADLFALLTLDKSPGDPSAKKLPGAQPVVPRQTNDPARFAELVGEIAPGFSTSRVGPSGLAVVAEHAGREGVLRTVPASRQQPCVLRRTVEVPEDKSTRLMLSVSHESRGVWNLIVQVDGKPLHQATVGGPDASAAWQTILLDLSALAGKQVNLELIHASTGGELDAAYWGQVEIVSQ